MKVSFSKALTRAIFRCLVLAAMLLCLISLALDSLEYLVLGQEIPTHRFDVASEASIPAWFSSSVLLLCSVLLAIVTSTLKRTSERYVRHWGALAILFALLSLDESISVHEMFSEPLRSLLSVGGPLHFAWVVPGGAFVVIIALAYRRFVFDLPAESRRLFILAGTLYLSGVLGLEMIGGLWVDLYGKQNWAYQGITTVEEILEMFGAIVFLYALMQYLGSLENSRVG